MLKCWTLRHTRGPVCHHSQLQKLCSTQSVEISPQLSFPAVTDVTQSFRRRQDVSLHMQRDSSVLMTPWSFRKQGRHFATTWPATSSLFVGGGNNDVVGERAIHGHNSSSMDQIRLPFVVRNRIQSDTYIVGAEITNSLQRLLRATWPRNRCLITG